MVYVAPVNADEGDIYTGTRVCRDCSTRKPMTEFFFTQKQLYRSRACKECWNVRTRERKKINPEARAQAARARNLRSKYGLTELGYQQLHAMQEGLCAICRSELGDAAHIDHDHSSGRVRGLLCFLCNTALGKFRDNVDLLKSAIEYLRREPPQADSRPKELTREELSLARKQSRRKPNGARTLSHSLSVRGDLSPVSSLTTEAVQEIRRRYAAGGISQRQLGVDYGCSQSAISCILQGKSWKFVPLEGEA